MTDQVLPLQEEDFFDLLSCLVSSAFLMCHGEQGAHLYPALRLMDGANRLAKAVISSGGFKDEPWLHKFVERCETGLNLLMTDPESFVEFVTESTGMLPKTRRKARATY
jgi:hypothetical protein